VPTLDRARKPTLDSNPVASTILTMVQANSLWQGIATDLVTHLVAMMSLRPPAPRAIPIAPPAWLPYLRCVIQLDALRLVYCRHET
jgi:hypothetical protein